MSPSLVFRGHSILLYFDDVSEKAIEAASQPLAAAAGGLGVVGERYGYRPHISLHICRGIDLQQTRQVLQRLARKTQPFPLQLSTVATGGAEGLFSMEGQPSFMLLPTPTQALLSLHASLHEHLSAEGVVVTQPSPDTGVGEWLPHVTVVQEVPFAQTGEVLTGLLGAVQLPLRVTVTAIGIISFRPGSDIYTFSLGSGESLPTTNSHHANL